MSETQRIHKVVKQWLDHADEDLRLAKHAFKLSSSRPNKLIAYHAQQCAEKYLKAFLALKKVDFPYTHNISLLLELSSKHAEWVKDLYEAETLTDYAVTARYPGAEKVTKKDAEIAAKIADKVRSVVRRALKTGRLGTALTLLRPMARSQRLIEGVGCVLTLALTILLTPTLSHSLTLFLRSEGEWGG